MKSQALLRTLAASWMFVVVGILVSESPFLVLAVLALLLLLWMANSRPEWLVLGLLAWLPLEGWVLKFVPGSSVLLAVPDIACLLLLAAIAFRLLARTTDESQRRALLMIGSPPLLLAAAALVSWALNRPPAIDAVYWLRVYLRFIPLALTMADSRVRGVVMRRLPVVALVVVVSQSAVGLLEYGIGASAARFFWPGQYALGGVSTGVDTLSTVGSRLVAGTLGHYNTYGMLLVLWLGVLVGHVRDQSQGVSGGRGWPVTVAVMVGSALVLLSQSRQSVAMLVILYVIWWLRGSTASSRLRMVVIASALMGLTLWGVGSFVGIQELSGRVRSLGDVWYWTVEFAKNRGYALTSVLPAVMREAPLLGIGPGSLTTAYGSSIGPVGITALGLDPVSGRFVSDVGWVAVLAQVGILGAGSLVWMVVRIVRRLRSREMDATTYFGGIAALAVLIVGMFASSPLTYKGTSSVMWTLVGLVFTASAERGTAGGAVSSQFESAQPRARSIWAKRGGEVWKP